VNTTLSVPEIHCDHCKMSIEGAVGSLDGVEKAEVTVATAKVDVTYAEPADLDQIVAAIEGQGYTVPAQG
jgi:copper chaperone